ncbi:hypothetical protein H4R21_006678, partial [Coemansia helicoidea]
MPALAWFRRDSGDGSTPTTVGDADCWQVIRGSDTVSWDHLDNAHIGWIIAGAFTLVATLIALAHMAAHLRNYTVPRQQRHIVRIIMIIPVYGIITFFSFRFYREAPYYLAIRDCYEAFVIASFYMLMLQYIGYSSDEQKRMMVDRRGLKWPFPFGCITMNPARQLTFNMLKWGIFQYVIIRPLGTLAAIVTQAAGVYCPNSMKPKYANFWLATIDFVSISVAMYALLSLYQVIKEDIREHKPLRKFMTIKLIIFLTFMEGFVIKWLGSSNTNVIKATKYWTKDNVVEGLTALLICIEMVPFAAAFLWSFPARVYKRRADTPRTPVRRAFMDTLNFADFFREA